MPDIFDTLEAPDVFDEVARAESNALRQLDPTQPARSGEELAVKRFQAQRQGFVPADGTAETFGQIISTPLLKLPELTPQIVKDAAQVFAVSLGESEGYLSPERAQEILEQPSEPPGRAAQVTAGALRSAQKVPEAFTSPLGAATLATGGAPLWLQRLVSLGFTADMLRATPEAWQHVGQVWDRGSADEKTEALGDALVNSAMVLSAGQHGFTPTKIRQARVLARQIAEAELREPTAFERAAPIEARGDVFDAVAPKVERFDVFDRVDPEVPRESAADPLQALSQKWADRGVRLDLKSTKEGGIELELMEVPESQRGQGIGTTVLNDVKALADQMGRSVELIPMSSIKYDAGRVVENTGLRLESFYERNGFERFDRGPKRVPGFRYAPKVERIDVFDRAADFPKEERLGDAEKGPGAQPPGPDSPALDNPVRAASAAARRESLVPKVEKEIAAARAKRADEVTVTEHTDYEDPALKTWFVGHKDAKGTWDVSEFKGEWIAERDGSVMRAQSREAAIEQARERIRDEVGDSRGTFGANMDNSYHVEELFSAFDVPEGMTEGGWFRTKWGSWYNEIKFEDANGETQTLKLSIRDHEPSRSDMGIPDKYAEVSKEWTPKEVAGALERIEQWLSRKANAGVSPGAAGIKTPLETQSQLRVQSGPNRPESLAVPGQPSDLRRSVAPPETLAGLPTELRAEAQADKSRMSAWQTGQGSALTSEQLPKPPHAVKPGLPSIEQATLPRHIEGATPVPAGEPVSLSSIREYLSEALDIPVRLGIASGVKRALGIFRPGYETIRLKMLNDVPTLAHEVGHYLHWILFPDSTARGRKWSRGGPKVVPGSDFATAFDAELIPLGRRTSGPRYSAQQVRWEGFAEFTREWMTDRTQALAKAPKFTAFFESELQSKFPEVWNIVNHGRELVGRYIHQPAQMKVRSMIAVAPEDRSVPPMRRAEKFYTDWVNQLRPIERALQTLETFGLDPGQARMVSDQAVNHIGGWRGKVEYSLRAKSIDLHGNEVGPSLREILGGGEWLDDFRDYLVARRALEKNSHGKATGIHSADARAVVNSLAPAYESHRTKLLDFQRQQRDLLVQSGVISKDQARAMDVMNEDYVPFFRVVESVGTGSTTSPNKSGFVSLGQGIGKFKGSDRQIIDPLESIVKNAYVFRDLAEKNQIGVLFVDAVEATRGGGRVAEEIARKVKPVEVKHAEVVQTLDNAGISTVGLIPAHVDLTFKVWRAARNQSPKDGVFTVWKNGKETVYQLGDVELHRALQMADVEGMKIQSALLRNLFVLPTRALRAGSTLTLEFMARNPFRDQVTAGVFSKHGFIPFVDGFRGILSAIGKDQWYRDWIKAGGRYSDFVAMDRTDLQATLADVIREPSALNFARQLADPRNILQNLRKLSELTEQATRISEFRRAKESGASDIEAANASKDVTLNFARTGRTGKAVNQLIAFFNASIQDLDKFVRAHRERPLQTSAKAIAYITVPSVLAWWLGKDDKEIQNLPEWRKNFFWNLNVRKMAALAGQDDAEDFVLSFPKPFLLGQIYGSSVERGLDYATQRDPNAVTKWFKGLLTQTPFSVVNLLPTATRPVVETAANHSFFRGQDIESAGQQRLPDEQRFTPNTSLVARKLASLTPWEMSPVKWDNTIRGYLGGLGKYGTDAADWLMVKGEVMDVPAPPAKGLSERPLLRGFARSPYEASVYVERFYNAVQAADQRIAALKKSPELMSSPEQQQWLKANGSDLAFYFQMSGGQRQIQKLHSAQEQLSAVNKAMVSVQTSREITPAEKSERLKQLARMRDALAENAFKTLVSPLDQKRHF